MTTNQSCLCRLAREVTPRTSIWLSTVVGAASTLEVLLQGLPPCLFGPTSVSLSLGVYRRAVLGWDLETWGTRDIAIHSAADCFHQGSHPAMSRSSLLQMVLGQEIFCMPQTLRLKHFQIFLNGGCGLAALWPIQEDTKDCHWRSWNFKTVPLKEIICQLLVSIL